MPARVVQRPGGLHLWSAIGLEAFEVYTQRLAWQTYSSSEHAARRVARTTVVDMHLRPRNRFTALLVVVLFGAAVASSARAASVPVAPPAPQQTAATSTQVWFRWSRPSDGGSRLREYEIWVNGMLNSKRTEVTTTAYVNVKPGVQYEIRLKACNAIGCSALSDPLWIGTPPDPPTNVAATGGSKSVTVSWTPSPSANVISHQVNYRVFGSTSGAAWNEWTPGTSDASPTTITGLNPSTRYEVRVTAKRLIGFAHSTSADATTAPARATTTTTTTIPSVSPTTVPQTSGALEVAAGGGHSCAILVNHSVACWGSNSYGELGDGTTIGRRTPTLVTGLASAVAQISAGEHHTCALLATGGVQCWGNNFYGQLGSGVAGSSAKPVPVVGLAAGVAQIVAADDSYSCALLSSGAVKCWGNNYYGQLGDGTRTDRRLPTAVPGLGSGVIHISAGLGHTCALLSSGAAKCWGHNHYGQLGDGTRIDRRLPTAVVGLDVDVTQIDAGAWHTCALLSSGAAKCWGSNNDGQLGDGTGYGRNAPVQVVDLPSRVARLAVGDVHTCALLSSGAVKCWGNNIDFQLGDGSGRGSSRPVQVASADAGVSQVSVGCGHTCALLSSGAVKCWGNNLYGQLGDGTVAARTGPVLVTGL